MKAYICDSCRTAIIDPYEENMREFYITHSFDFGGIYPKTNKRKVKIHLCDKCYKGLHSLAEKVGSENNV